MSLHMTPFRYPGGKQKLTPFVLELLHRNRLDGGHYVEPYAGGAGVAIELLTGGHVASIHLNDSCYPIAAFWNSVISCPEALCRKIASASLTVEEWKLRREIVRHPAAYDELEVGFSAFYLNRCNRSGVLSGGLIGGLSQAGKWRMDARFPRNELIRRVEAIAVHRRVITVTNLDAERLLLELVPAMPDKTLIYCDPPYFDKSNRLYLNRYAASDHKRIASVIQARLPRPWFVSYDCNPVIRSFYINRSSFEYDLNYHASRSYVGQELLIFSDSLFLPKESSLPAIDKALCTIRDAYARTINAN